MLIIKHQPIDSIAFYKVNKLLNFFDLLHPVQVFYALKSATNESKPYCCLISFHPGPCIYFWTGRQIRHPGPVSGDYSGRLSLPRFYPEPAPHCFPGWPLQRSGRSGYPRDNRFLHSGILPRKRFHLVDSRG